MHRSNERSRPSSGFRRTIRRATASVRSASFTRQGAMAAARRLEPERLLSPFRMALLLLVGSTSIGFGVSFLVHGDLGLPPYDVMLSAIRIHSGLSHGQAAWVAAICLFSLATLLGRPPRPGGIVLSALNGFSIDIAGDLLIFPEPLELRILFSAIGTVAIATGIALVVFSGTTGGAFDLLMQAGADRGFSAKRVRTLLELTVIVAGVSAGGTFGLVTVVFAITIGPLLHSISQALVDHRMGRQTRLQDSLDVVGRDQEDKVVVQAGWRSSVEK